MTIDTALITTDFSEGSLTALTYAAKAFADENTRLHLVTVVEGLPPMRTGAINEVEQFHNARRRVMIEEAEAELANLKEEYLPASTEITALHGDEPVVSQVCNFAKEKKAQMLLTSNKGRGAISNLIHGSVVQKIINLAPCPVLVVSG